MGKRVWVRTNQKREREANEGGGMSASAMPYGETGFFCRVRPLGRTAVCLTPSAPCGGTSPSRQRRKMEALVGASRKAPFPRQWKGSWPAGPEGMVRPYSPLRSRSDHLPRRHKLRIPRPAGPSIGRSQSLRCSSSPHQTRLRWALVWEQDRKREALRRGEEGGFGKKGEMDERNHW